MSPVFCSGVDGRLCRGVCPALYLGGESSKPVLVPDLGDVRALPPAGPRASSSSSRHSASRECCRECAVDSRCFIVESLWLLGSCRFSGLVAGVVEGFPCIRLCARSSDLEGHL